MNEKIKIELGSIQKTLLLPLWGRAVETLKPNPKLKDTAAAEIINNIDYDFSTIASKISFVTQLAWIARSIHIDRTIEKFLSAHPEGTIVNLGCGLDTTYERVNNGKLTWFDLDLPDVITLRKSLIHETPNRKFISASIADEKWTEQIPVRQPVLMTAAGVLYYLEEWEVKKLFQMVSGSFVNAELVFDAVTPLGVKTANEKVIKESGMDEAAILKWGIKSAKVLEDWGTGIKVIEEYPLFKGVKKGLSFKEKYGLFLADLLKIMFMVQVRF